MTYQGARSRLVDNETKRFFSVSKIRLDDAGWITQVLGSEVDSKSNLDVGEHVVVPVGDVVDAILDGAQVRALFSPTHRHLPDQTFEVIHRADGSHAISLAKRLSIETSQLARLQDIAAIGDHAQPKKTATGFSSRRRSHAVYAISKVGLDLDGRVTHVRWGRVNTTTNQWIGKESMSPVADAVVALKAGDQIFALFGTAHGHMPGQQFSLVNYDDGRETIVLQGKPIDEHEIHDIDRLAGMLR